MKHRIHLSKEAAKHMKEYGEQIPATKVADLETIREASDTGAQSEPASQEETETASFAVVTRTDIGKVRASNQDAVIEAGRLVGVADGMGGHQGGETASAGARDGLINNVKDLTPDQVALDRAIKAVNRRLYMQAQVTPKLKGMGTTLSVIWVGEKDMYLGHVGDSRIYRLREGNFEQMTEDHSVVHELLRAGMITPEEAVNHPYRNVITRAVGTESGIHVDTRAVPRQAGDLWLICSDGLHGLVRDNEMAEMLQNNPPDKAADLLLQAAMDAGGRDNISLVILLDKEGEQ